MEKELLITLLLPIVAILAIIALIIVPASQTQNDTIGLMVSQKGIDSLARALNLKVFLNDAKIAAGSAINVTANTTIKVSLSRQRFFQGFDQNEQDQFDNMILKGNDKDQKKLHVDFAAVQQSGCTVSIGSDYSWPYSILWKPAAAVAVCGYGNYTVSATLVHPIARISASTTVILQQPVPQVIVHGYPVDANSEVTASNSAYGVIASSGAYPPAPGTSPSQTFADLMTPPTQEPNEKLLFVVNVNGNKVSSTDFNLDYRVFDATNSTVLASSSLVNPVGPTNSSLVFTEVMSSPGSHEVLFQFKPSVDFDAVVLNSYDIEIYRVLQ